jgi:hypothetical protein
MIGQRRKIVIVKGDIIECFNIMIASIYLFDLTVRIGKEKWRVAVYHEPHMFMVHNRISRETYSPRCNKLANLADGGNFSSCCILSIFKRKWFIIFWFTNQIQLCSSWLSLLPALQMMFESPFRMKTILWFPN